MTVASSVRNIALLAAVLWIAGCAATQSFVQTPLINLTSVELDQISLKGQTFLLGFDIENPNSFPLPVKMIRYKVMLEGHKFAGGEAQCDILIPARGDGKFVMSVELDLLQMRADLTSIVRGGMSGDVEYEIVGSLTLDIPFTRPIDFSSTGTVAVQSIHF